MWYLLLYCTIKTFKNSRYRNSFRKVSAHFFIIKRKNNPMFFYGSLLDILTDKKYNIYCNFTLIILICLNNRHYFYLIYKICF